MFMLRQAWRRSIAPFQESQVFRTSFSSQRLQKSSDSATLETKAPQPGTVSPYEHHVFLRFPPKLVPDAGPGSWWPKIVERCAAFTLASAFIETDCDPILWLHQLSVLDDFFACRMPEFLQAFAAVAANRKHIEGKSFTAIPCWQASSPSIGLVTDASMHVRVMTCLSSGLIWAWDCRRGAH